MKRAVVTAALFVSLCAFFDSFLLAQDPAGVDLEKEGWKCTEMKFMPLDQASNFVTRFEQDRFKEYYQFIKDGFIHMPLKGKNGFQVEEKGASLKVDADGDGVFDQEAKGGVGRVTLTLVHDDGTTSPFTVFLGDWGSHWVYCQSCCMTGTVEGQRLALVDVNCDGRYDNIGTDEFVVGSGRYTCPLGRIVEIGDSLYNIKVDPYGRKVWTKKFEGETGKIDVLTKYKTVCRLEWAVFTDGKDLFFDLAKDGKTKEHVVPVGEYKLLIGYLVAPRFAALPIHAGNMQPVKVENGGTTAFAWGMPVKIDFLYDKSEGVVTVKESDVKIFGSGGEEYKYIDKIKFLPQIIVQSDPGGGVIKTQSWPVRPVDGVAAADSASVAGLPAAGGYRVKLVENRNAKLFGVVESELK